MTPQFVPFSHGGHPGAASSRYLRNVENQPQTSRPIPSPVPGLSDLSVIARGGYATVYKARQNSVGREVALKVDTRTLEDERDRRRFLREAEAAGRMSGHPNVVNVYDAGVTPDNHPYLVMELCTGGSYATKLKRNGPLSPAEVRDVGVKIADALHAAHQAGILHRDVKPGNILINAYGVPGLADFGLAAIPDPSRELSVTVEALTPAYAPPEVFRMEKPTPSGDIFGLAATLYAMLSGRPPRWPDTGTPSLATMVRLHEEPVPDLPGVPLGLTNVLRQALEADPAHRYPTAAAFRDALGRVSLDPATAFQKPVSPAPAAQGFAAAAPMPTRVFNRVPTSGPPQPPPFRPPPGYGPAAPPPNKRGLVIAGVIVAVLLLLGGVGTAAVLIANNLSGTPENNVTPTPSSDKRGSSPTPTPSPSPSENGGPFLPTLPTSGVLGDCPLETVGTVTGLSVRCPSEPECFDELENNSGEVKADTRKCSSRHTWETFVISELPDSVTSAKHDAVSADPIVQTLCGQSGLSLALKGGSTVGWSTEVLPPSEDDFEDGKREFRCLAGKGKNKLDKAYFA